MPVLIDSVKDYVSLGEISDVYRQVFGLYREPIILLGRATMGQNGISITKTTQPKGKPKDADLAFGTEFTDHMFLMNYHVDKGWYDPARRAVRPAVLDPAAAVLHYAQSMFEGLKAFRGKDGKVRMFRPTKHVERLNRTAQLLCIPTIDPDMVLKSWSTLVGLDREWVPKMVGTSLYIRPTLIASEPFLGVRPAKEYLYFVILSPVGRTTPRASIP